MAICPCPSTVSDYIKKDFDDNTKKLNILVLAPSHDINVDVDENLQDDQYAARITVENGILSTVKYGRKQKGAPAFNWIQISALVNLYSREEMPCGRLYLSMDISCIVACRQIGLKNIVRFPYYNNMYYIGREEYHINDILNIINNERIKRRNHPGPNIIIIPYRQHFQLCSASHVVALVVDLNINGNSAKCMCFDSSHFIIGENGIKIEGSFGSLISMINKKALNTRKYQCCCKCTCTFWVEAFMRFAGLFIHQNYNNPQLSLDDVKDFINMHYQGLIDEFKKVIQTDSGCHNVFCHTCCLAI